METLNKIVHIKGQIKQADLSPDNPDFKHLEPEIYIKSITNNFQDTALGGYLEKRRMYEVSPLFQGERYRNIHLGIDIWQAAGSKIKAPFEGEVHSFQNNNEFGDYGPTIILKHDIQNQVFYTLYGHLNTASLENLAIGQIIKEGQEFCAMGEAHENGGWPPHLHFQIILDIKNYQGDYPGVCFEDEIEYWSANCPDPIQFMQDLHSQ